jgi:hypothetical protein
MRFLHPEHPGRVLRLATCMNLWPVAQEDGREASAAEPIISGLTEISLPLRDRLETRPWANVPMSGPA